MGAKCTESLAYTYIYIHLYMYALCIVGCFVCTFESNQSQNAKPFRPNVFGTKNGKWVQNVLAGLV